MVVYKFGGASVKDAKGVRNFLATMKALDNKEVLIVISAMGKMTNALENVVDAYLDRRQDLKEKLEVVYTFHQGLIRDLGFKPKDRVYDVLTAVFDEIHSFLKQNNSTDYDYVYDQ